MADEPASTSLGVCAKITVALVTVRPGLTILRFWQGIVDLILRAVVVGLALVALIAGSVYGGNGAAILAGDGRNAVGGWIGFVAFIVMVIELGVIAARFINWAFVFQYALIMMIANVVYSGVAALGLAIGFIVTAANAADFQQRAGTGTGTVNNLSARDSAAATSAFCFFVVAALVTEIVWAVLWYLLKWYLVLKNKYEGHSESSGEGEEKEYS